MSGIYSERVFVALGIQHATRIHRIAIRGRSDLPCFSTLPNKRYYFGKIYWPENMYFSLQLLSGAFIILRRIELYFVINVRRIT
jgi:polyferredoxin